MKATSSPTSTSSGPCSSSRPPAPPAPFDLQLLGRVIFEAGALKLVITQGSTTLYDGDFGALDNANKLDLGALNVGQSTTVTYTVSMPQAAGNGNQGKSASAGYRFVTTQTGDNGDVKWVPGI